MYDLFQFKHNQFNVFCINIHIQSKHQVISLYKFFNKLIHVQPSISNVQETFVRRLLCSS